MSKARKATAWESALSALFTITARAQELVAARLVGDQARVEEMRVEAHDALDAYLDHMEAAGLEAKKNRQAQD